MEVVGLVSSLAGIAAFTGQALDGIIKLRAFWKDVAGAETTSLELVNELENLTATLTDIKQLVASLDDVSDDRADPEAMIGLSSLTTNLTCCLEDVVTWVRVVKNADPSSATGIRAFLKKMKVAADKSGIQEISRKVSSHQKRLGLSLSVLGRVLDHASIARLDKLSTKFDGLTESQLKLNDSINSNIAALAATKPLEESFTDILKKDIRPLEASIENGFDRMSVNHSESQQSIRSLSNSISSLASQMSQLLNISNTLDPKQKGPLLRQLEVLPSSDIAELEDEWCCDALSGIDDGFVEDGDHHDRCIFCSFTNFRGGLDSSHEKGRHLVETHSFGKCNLMITYSTWEALDMHLLYFHNSRLYESRVGEPPLLIRFRRKERVRPFFRDVENDSDHPSNIIERATEGLIIKDRLRIALNELYSDESCKCRPYAQIPLLRSDFRMEEPFPNQRYKIACLLEELIVSDNEQYLECFLGPWPILTPETSAFMKDRFEERSIINAWLLKILGESLSLRVLLLCGKAFPVVHPAIPSNWLFPILSFWDADEAATGFEQIHQPSDGAVDSRDDLGWGSR